VCRMATEMSMVRDDPLRNAQMSEDADFLRDGEPVPPSAQTRTTAQVAQRPGATSRGAAQIPTAESAVGDAAQYGGSVALGLHPPSTTHHLDSLHSTRKVRYVVCVVTTPAAAGTM
jgi:hypothetical protein